MIQSPFIRVIRPGGDQPKAPEIRKSLDITVKRPRGAGTFLDGMATWALAAVGAGAAISFCAYETGSAADIVGTLAFISWNAACVMAISEHSRARETDKIVKEDQEIIKQAIEQFKKS